MAGKQVPSVINMAALFLIFTCLMRAVDDAITFAVSWRLVIKSNALLTHTITYFLLLVDSCFESWTSNDTGLMPVSSYVYIYTMYNSGRSAIQTPVFQHIGHLNTVNQHIFVSILSS